MVPRISILSNIRRVLIGTLVAGLLASTAYLSIRPTEASNRAAVASEQAREYQRQNRHHGVATERPPWPFIFFVPDGERRPSRPDAKPRLPGSRHLRRHCSRICYRTF